jgi:cell division septum initiation protein DivIVA
MNHPATAREALIVEAIGEVAKLIKDVEALAPILNESCRALQQASNSLRDELAGFERRIAAIAENAKAQTVKYIAARTNEAAGRSIEQQSRAMADAARVAFGAELGATMQRLQTTLQLLLERRESLWERWLTHAAAAMAGSAATWALALSVGPR